MKKIISFLFATIIISATLLAVPTVSMDKVKPLKAKEVMIPIGKTGQKISLYDLSKLSVKEYQSLAGVKFNFFDRVMYKKAIKKLNNSIDEQGTITNKKLNKYFADNSSGVHGGGLALGILLGLIGVLIAYLINDDKKKNRVKWAWIGFGIGFVLGLIVISVL